MKARWLKLPGCRVAHAGAKCWQGYPCAWQHTKCGWMTNYGTYAPPDMPRCKRCQRALAKEER